MLIKCNDTGEIFNNYNDYLLSNHWYNKRKSYFKTYEKKCNHCGTDKEIHLHHLTYENIGNESFNDLMPLCKDCHSKEHDRLKKLKSLKKKYKPKNKKRKNKIKSKTVECKNCEYFKFGSYCDSLKKTPPYYYKKRICKRYKKK